ncbi:MAG: hypothetical protein HY683_10720 [Chloroflexi bacterium]|nr:hypothetical protein [Chloroflexota bacterium]
MGTKVRIASGIALLLTLLYGLSAGCTYFSPVVGKWEDTASRNTIEFTRGGDVIIKSGGSIVTGKYELVGSDVIKVKFEGFSGSLMTVFAGDAWQYSISGDSMTLTLAGEALELKRVKTAASS